MKFNINDYVKVKLTAKGKEILISNEERLRKEYKIVPELTIKYDENGYTSFQMWELMSLFGESIYLGTTIPFEVDIIIDDAYLQKE